MLKDLNYWRFKYFGRGMIHMLDFCNHTRMDLYHCKDDRHVFQLCFVADRKYSYVIMSIRVSQISDIPEIIISLDKICNTIGRDQTIKNLNNFEKRYDPYFTYGPGKYPNYLDLSKFDYISSIGRIGVNI